MYNYQRLRLFPLPDYNLADNRVEVTITGKILDMNYANILAGNSDLNLLDIELLNRVQLEETFIRRRDCPIEEQTPDRRPQAQSLYCEAYSPKGWAEN